jgi:hypothetical protein
LEITITLWKAYQWNNSNLKNQEHICEEYSEESTKKHTHNTICMNLPLKGFFSVPDWIIYLQWETLDIFTNTQH